MSFAGPSASAYNRRDMDRDEAVRALKAAALGCALGVVLLLAARYRPAVHSLRP
jgi:hypothetical protein